MTVKTGIAEVIGPIKIELSQNKAAGKFSIFGFWVGAIGLIVSIVTVFYSSFIEKETLVSEAASKQSVKTMYHFNDDGRFAKKNSINITYSITEYEDRFLKTGGASFKSSNVINNPNPERILFWPSDVIDRHRIAKTTEKLENNSYGEVIFKTVYNFSTKDNWIFVECYFIKINKLYYLVPADHLYIEYN
jgi:hypothetical protein